MSWGVFKGTYRGEGIYWNGVNGYNIEGAGKFKTQAAVKLRIDELIAAREIRDRENQQAKAVSGNYLVCRRVGDGATMETPDGTLSFSTMREIRQRIFALEEQYDREILWIDE